MKHTNDPESEERFHGLQVLYVEDLLTAREKTEFEEHVRSCSQCAREIEDLKTWYNRLTTDKEAFCPEQWELYEHVCREDDSMDHVGRHRESCPLCEEAASDLCSAPSERQMPDQLWDKMQPLFRRQIADQPRSRLVQWLDSFIQVLADTFRSPALALGSAAAIVLLLAVVYTHLYPPSRPELIPLLSSTSWDLGLNLMGETRQRIAVVPFLKLSEEPLSQSQVDALYRAMAPPEDVTERFGFIEPGQLKAQVASGRVRLVDRSEMLKDVASNLEVSLVALLTITKSDAGFTIDAQLIDTETGKVRKEETLRTSAGELGSGLKSVLISLLSSQTAGSPAPARRR